MMSSPQVCVVLPTYNRAGVIQRAIDSVLNQTFTEFKLAIIDDDSTDNTVEIISQYDDSRIKLIQHESNKGANAARNTGIKQSSAKYIAFIDSDDRWLPKKLEKQINRFKNSELNPGVVYTGTCIVQENQRRVGDVPSSRGDIFEKEILFDQVSPTSAVMVKRECFESIGVFDESLCARQDYDMWLRISEKYKFDFIKEPLVGLYRDHSDRISMSINKRIQAEKDLYAKKRERYSEVQDWNKIRGFHDLSVARHAYVLGRYDVSRQYSLQSIQRFPYCFMTWAILLLSILKISHTNRVVSTVRGKIKK